MTGTKPELDSPQRVTSAERRRRRAASVRRVLLGVIAVIIAGVAGLCGYFKMSPLELPRLLAMGGEFLSSKLVVKPPFHGRRQVNILVLGTDVNFVDKGTPRSDTIKLASVDLDKGSIAVLSIPRDTWVEIPGHGHAKINSVFQRGGDTEVERINYTRKFLAGFLTDVSGQPVSIDYYVRIQTGGFKRIVNAMGGVWVDVEKQMDYDDNYQNLYIHLKPGRQKLNGTQAMGYVRFRHDRDGDYGRMRRQDQFIRAVAAQLNTPEMKRNWHNLVGPMMSLMVTNMSINDIKTMKTLAGTLGMEGLHTVQLPTEPDRRGAASVVVINDEEAARQAVCEVLNGPRTTVVVLNGSGNRNLGREVSELLDERLFNVVGIGTLPEPIATTEVLTKPRCAEQAQTLATQLGITEVDTENAPPPDASFGKHSTPPPPSEVTLVLGKDYTVPDERAGL